MDKWELEDRIIEVLSNTELEWMTTKQIVEELSNVFNVNENVKKVRARADSLVNHGMVESQVTTTNGHSTNLYRVVSA